ncbi:MAG: hypothetical protein GX160_00475, partial [Clostridiales bacterium]|nr:hypothetical protein [Clostridiales bacterium]
MSTSKKIPILAIGMTAIFLLMTFLIPLSPILADANEPEADPDAMLSDLLDIVSQLSDENSYEHYLDIYSNEERPDTVIRIEGEEYIEA